MFSKHKGEASVNVAVEVFGVLSTHEPKDAVDVLRETKEAIRAKINERVKKATSSLPSYVLAEVKDDLDSHIHYDFVLEILHVLVKNGKVKQQLGKNGLEEFLRM